MRRVVGDECDDALVGSDVAVERSDAEAIRMSLPMTLLSPGGARDHDDDLALDGACHDRGALDRCDDRPLGGAFDRAVEVRA